MIPNDNFTSTVDGAAGYERMRAEHDDYDETPSRWELNEYPDKDDEDIEDDEPECNCSDPGCPCGGHKIGGL